MSVTRLQRKYLIRNDIHSARHRFLEKAMVFPILYPAFVRGSNGSDFRIVVPIGDIIIYIIYEK